MKQFLLLVALLLTSASILSAHEGHGRAGDGSSWLHFLSEPLHSLSILLLLFAGLGVLLFRRRRTAPQRKNS